MQGACRGRAAAGRLGGARFECSAACLPACPPASLPACPLLSAPTTPDPPGTPPAVVYFRGAEQLLCGSYEAHDPFQAAFGGGGSQEELALEGAAPAAPLVLLGGVSVDESAGALAGARPQRRGAGGGGGEEEEEGEGGLRPRAAGVAGPGACQVPGACCTAGGSPWLSAHLHAYPSCVRTCPPPRTSSPGPPPPPSTLLAAAGVGCLARRQRAVTAAATWKDWRGTSWVWVTCCSRSAGWRARGSGPTAASAWIWHGQAGRSVGTQEPWPHHHACAATCNCPSTQKRLLS
mgnify:CR=1 FL=1